MAKPMPPAASGGELEALKVLWDLRPGEEALKLSQVHERMSKHRETTGDAPPALTTVSTILRGAATKGLLQEVKLTDEGAMPFERPAMRSSFVSARSSPKVAYQAAYTPSEIMVPMFRLLVEAYPADQRQQALLDMASALGLDDSVRQAISKLLRKL